jgi:2-polyprenyl-3-methyl-5-hydroxy-6-metoxy-1,4-benzoquinol methylase
MRRGEAFRAAAQVGNAMNVPLLIPSSTSGELVWPCPLCACPGARVRLTMKPGPFQVVECPRCGLARTYPPVPPEEIQRFYPPSYYGTANRRFHPLMEKLVRLFRGRVAQKVQRLLPAGRILDVGCGRGHFLTYLRRCGWQTCGIEFSEVAARHAREVHGLAVHVGDFLTVPLEAGSFDVVIFWHVLEHVQDAAAAIARAADLIREGGLLVVAVPNLSSLQAACTGRHWFHLDIPRHYTHFHRATLLRLLARHGFKAVRVDHFSVEQNIYGWLQSLYNGLGFEFNLLYNLLKTRSARDIRAPFRTYRVQTVVVLLLLPSLLALSVALFLLEGLFRRGGTMEVYAGKQGRALPAGKVGAVP